MTFWDSKNFKGGFMLPQYGFQSDIKSNYYNLPPPPLDDNDEPSTIVKIAKGYGALLGIIPTPLKSRRTPPPVAPKPVKRNPPPPPPMPPFGGLKAPQPPKLVKYGEIKYGEKGCKDDDCSKCYPPIPEGIICEQGKKLKKVDVGDKKKNFDDDILAAVLNPKLKKGDDKWKEEKELRNRARKNCNDEGNKDGNYKTCCSNSNGCKHCKGPLEELKCKNYNKNKRRLFFK